MNNSMQVFENSEFGSLEIVMINEKPYFPATDCARILGYLRPADAITAHCKGSVKRRVLTGGGLQEIKLIPEGDIYRLIIKSKLPAAEKFEYWIFDEVLPRIRKYGMYATPEKIQEALVNPDTMIMTLQELKKEQEKNKALETSNKLLSAEILAWTDRASLNRAIRIIAIERGIYPGTVWNELYAELLYKHHIDVKKRGSSPFVQHIREYEWTFVQQSLAAICEQHDINSSDVYFRAKISA